MKDMKRLFGYMGPYKKDMILGALFVMIETGFELFIPIMISNLIDIGVANHDVNYIYVKGVQMALLALGALVFCMPIFQQRPHMDGVQRFERQNMQEYSSMHFLILIIL